MGAMVFHQRRDTSTEPPDESLVGKLKLFFPSLYNTLFARESLTINSLASSILNPELLGSGPLEFESSLHSPPSFLGHVPLSTYITSWVSDDPTPPAPGEEKDPTTLPRFSESPHSE